MSAESASKFFDKLNSDAELLKRVQNAETLDEVVAIGSELGFDFTAEEFSTAGNMPVDDSELTDDDLENVAGGRAMSYSSNAPGCSLAPQTKISSCSLTIKPGCEGSKGGIM